jgi:hypothetical protein
VYNHLQSFFIPQPSRIIWFFPITLAVYNHLQSYLSLPSVTHYTWITQIHSRPVTRYPIMRMLSCQILPLNPLPSQKPLLRCRLLLRRSLNSPPRNSKNWRKSLRRKKLTGYVFFTETIRLLFNNIITVSKRISSLYHFRR